MRLRWVLAAGVLVALACWRDATGPAFAPRARVAMVAELESGAALGVVPISSIRLTLTRLNGEVALDTTAAVADDADSIALALTVPLALIAPGDPPSEYVIARAVLFGPLGDSVFVGGPDTVMVVSGVLTPIGSTLRYVGVGYDAASVSIDSASASGSIGEERTFVATAFDTAGAPIPGTPVIWRAIDTLIVGVARPDSGRVILGSESGMARVEARLFNGKRDTVQIEVFSPPRIGLSASSVRFMVPASIRSAPPVSVMVVNLGQEPLTDLEVVSIDYTGETGWLVANLDSTNADAPLVLSVIATDLPIGEHQAAAVIGSPVAVNGTVSLSVAISITEAQSVSGGSSGSCSLSSDGAAYCWGSYPGNGTVGPSPAVPVAGGLVFASVTSGGQHHCGLTASGAAYCWGVNANGRLGDGSTTTRLSPTAVTGGHLFQALSAGGDYTCGVTTSGVALCWGGNVFGQLGTGNTTAQATPTAVNAGGVLFQSIATNRQHTCALSSGAAAYCWGGNTSGQLGSGVVGGQQTSPLPVTGGLTFSSLAVGDAHTCGIGPAGAASCWGSGLSNKLGTGVAELQPAPVTVLGGLQFVSITAGFYHTCGLTASASVHCWGTNDYGQLGDGTNVHRAAPTPVVGGLSFRAIDAGPVRTCGVTTTSETHCWGPTGLQQSGINELVYDPSPVAVSGGLSFAELSSYGTFTCGVTTLGDAHCWGSNPTGELGDGTTIGRAVPTPVVGGIEFSSLATGRQFTCGLAVTGAAYCWGSGAALGVGSSTAISTTPMAVSGGLVFESIAAGATHACGIATGGAAYCWGSIAYLGTGTATPSNVPAAVGGGLLFRQLDAALTHTCGLTTDNRAYCWGFNDGIGDGTTEARTLPAAVIGNHRFSKISTGTEFTCALDESGAAFCWGENNAGQLGIGNTSTPALAPVAAAAGMTFVDIGTGPGHVCAIDEADALWCWGNGFNGALGNGTDAGSLVPTPVLTGLRFRAVVAGAAHTCGITLSNAAYCWGSIDRGQLGNGSTAFSPIPRRVPGL
jgi:alpha-tubulin suppressor-like RCC1 family protein